MKSLWQTYLQTFKDIVANQTIFTTLILSVLFYSFFYPTAYRSQQAEALPIIVVDEERSALTAAIINQVAKSPQVDIITVSPNFAEAKRMLTELRADGILLLPDHLSQSIRHQETGGIGLYLSAANFLKTKQIGLGLASSIEQVISEYGEKYSLRTEFSPALSIHQIPLFNTLSGYGSYIFPAVAPLIIHQTILLGLGMLIATYREQQPKWQLKPIQFTSIFFSLLTIGCLGSYYLFGFTFWLYDYPRGGNFWGMLLAVPIFVSCIISLSFVFASFLDMPERAGHILVCTSIPLFLLSGVAWPHSAMPQWLAAIGQILPSTQGVQMFVQLNQMGVPTVLVIPKMIYLLCVTLVCILYSRHRYKINMNKNQPY